ncbi:LexA family transcriptional regulator [Vreelandella venusta]|uniref:XRE family transcriptional regulator n=1 Tax=Vreelandella venusta TaxID=44935 RepID=UPI00384E6F6F
MNSFGSRLKEERVRLGMSQEAFGEAGGVKKVAQYNYETDKRAPDAYYLQKLRALGVDVNYLFSGTRSDGFRSNNSFSDGSGERFNSSKNNHSATAEDQAAYLNQRMNDPNVASIPMYDVECAAGSGRSFEGEPVLGYFHMDRTVLSELKLPSDSGAWVRARGDSMVGTIDDGDYVFVDFTQRDPSREGVYLILMDGERRIKRMQRVAGGGWLLISDNPRYDKELIAPEQKQFVEVLGRCLVNLGQVL